MGEDESRTALVRKLENFFGKKVILIVYNPEFEGGVEPGDERFIGWVIEKERKNEPINNLKLFKGSIFLNAAIPTTLVPKFPRMKIEKPIISAAKNLNQLPPCSPAILASCNLYQPTRSGDSIIE